LKEDDEAHLVAEPAPFLAVARRRAVDGEEELGVLDRLVAAVLVALVGPGEEHCEGDESQLELARLISEGDALYALQGRCTRRNSPAREIWTMLRERREGRRSQPQLGSGLAPRQR